MSARAETPRNRRTTHYLVPFWLLAAAGVALAHRWMPESTWLMVHLVVLGALTQSIVRWSGHFAEALLKVSLRPATDRLSWPLALAVTLVLAGVPTGAWWVTLAGASAVAGIVLVHGWALLGGLRRALPGRFRAGLRYYVAATSCLPVGAGFGVALARGQDQSWEARLLVAHTMTNLLGWLGLAVVGTLLTLWPTVLGVPADAAGDRRARLALPALLSGLAVTVAGALAGTPWLASVGLGVYLLGLLAHGPAFVAAWTAARARRAEGGGRPPGYAAGALGLGAAWLVASAAATGGVLVWAPSPQAITDTYPLLTALWVVGFGLQTLTGAMAHLLPAVLGGGPSVARAGASVFDRAAGFRLTVLNAGLLAWLVPAPSWVRVAVSLLVLGVLIASWVLMILGLRAALAELRRVREAGPALPPALPPAGAPRARAARPAPAPLSAAGLVAGVAALALAVSLGVLADPAASGLPTTDAPAAAGVAGAVAPTGTTVRVRVEARDMRFTPARIDAKAGDRVVIDLVNTDPASPHDLAIAGLRTDRLAPGQSATLDLGVVSASTQGWCTVVGHRQMGMVLDLVVAGAPAQAATPASGGTTGMPMPGHAAPASAAPLTRTVDAATRPSPERVHKLTLRVTEVALEVAPGVWQKRWTYNGSGVGPTLRGRVGDEFDVTLINGGTMGHSIDFHAGELAPDQPMRTIAPGQSLEYRFTAAHAGIWMYHCSTMPMSAHIAAGMHGAVIIEPKEGLPPVDREYVLVQSEVYLAAPAGSANSAAGASEVDADAVAAQSPTYVVFNGIANQYDQHPLAARVGERVRLWVLDAGPNRATSFHVVGGQFDTVYSEGAYLLKDGRDAFGQATGGAQVLPLQPAQGGFVELVFHEAGHYPVVSHVMSDAERGAHGVLAVTE